MITIVEFLNLEAINEDNPKNIDKNDFEIDETGNLVDNFIDGRGESEQTVEDYYAFHNVTRNIVDALQDAFINYESQEANNYCREDFDPENEIIDCFKDTAVKIDEFKKSFLVCQETDCIDLFSYLICYAIRYQKANKKKNVKMI